MSLYTPRKTTSNKVRIVFERETLEDDWEVDEIQGAEIIEPPSGRSEHDWVWDFATTTVNEDHFFDPAEVDGVLKVAVTGVLEGWWSSTTEGDDYDEEFELETLEVLTKAVFPGEWVREGVEVKLRGDPPRALTDEEVRLLYNDGKPLTEEEP